jgi:hypothetical protein
MRGVIHAENFTVATRSKVEVGTTVAGFTAADADGRI